MGKSRNELRRARRAKTREALANTDPDNVELQQRAERYHTAKKAEREAREAEYPGLTTLEIDQQKALQEEAEARTAVDTVQSQLRNREQRLKQAKDAGERRAVTDSITLIKSKLGAALVVLNAAEAKVTKKTKEVEADEARAKAKAEETLVPDTGGQSTSLGEHAKAEAPVLPDLGDASHNPWGELTFTPWLYIEDGVEQPAASPAHSPSPPPPPPPQNSSPTPRPHAPSPAPPAVHSATPPLPPQHSPRPALLAHSPQAAPSPHLSAPILEPVISDSAAKTLEPGSGKAAQLCLRDLIGYSSSSSSSASPSPSPSPSPNIGEPVTEPVILSSSLTQREPDTGEVQGQENALRKRKYMEIS